MYSHPHAQYTRQVHAYERTVRRKVPQWVKALDRRDAQRLLKVCSELKWRLNPRLLLEAEQYCGPYSLWAQRALPIDVESARLSENRVQPLDLMNLPFDPAEAAARACGKRQTGK